MKRLALLSIIIVFLSTPSYGFFGIINNPVGDTATNPGGSNGDIQYNNNGSLGGKTAAETRAYIGVPGTMCDTDGKTWIMNTTSGKMECSASAAITDNCTAGNICVHGSGTLENADLEIDAHTALGSTIALVPGVCRLIHNYNQGASDIDNTVDDPAKGKCFVMSGKTAQGSNRFRLTPVTTTNKICLDGTCSKNYIQFSPVTANSLAVCVSVPNGSSSYEYQCVSVVGTASTN